MNGPEQIIVPGLAEAADQQKSPASGKTAVSIYDGHIVLHFERATEHAVYAPLGAISDAAKMIAMAVSADKSVGDLAIKVAMFLIDHVYEERGEIKPASGAVKHELVERHRRTLTKRMEVILNSQREKKTKSNHKLAQDLVGVCLNEVFT